MKMFPVLLLVIAFSCVPKETPKETASKLTDEQLLDTVQYYTFQYFWTGAEPNSGMAPERIHIDGDYPANDQHVVTTGGTGMGLSLIHI